MICNIIDAKEGSERFASQLNTVSTKADIDIVSNANKTADCQLEFCGPDKDNEICAGWTKKGETSCKDYGSFSLTAPEFDPKKLYANFSKAAGFECE